MSNAQISKLGWEVLNNPLLADAISSAILNKQYTPDRKGIVVQYNGNEFIVDLWPYQREIKIINGKK